MPGSARRSRLEVSPHVSRSTTRRGRALLVAACVLLTMGACSSDDRESRPAGSEGTIAPTQTHSTSYDDTRDTTGVGATTRSEVQRSAVIRTRRTSLGTVLVDGRGFTLYAFVNDAAGVPTCTGACADLWPPVLGDRVEVSPDLDASDFSTAPRDDGGRQVRLREIPLYRYSGDEKPGDINGHGVAGVWTAVGPDGPIPLD
ncbi:MAG: hypothetical protein KatS3mg008_0808 [Acidimicrobiales bacterium]|nr:MAG: hypothetical protein KatS3mg008_0808 [Acidimicrobiales bacterium]